MKHVVFSVYDDKACFYSTPFCGKTDNEGIRMFMAAVCDSGTAIARFPADYSLYRLGIFDDSSGSLEPCSPVFLSRGSEHIQVSAKPAEAL